jgi:hypothetical protein
MVSLAGHITHRLQPLDANFFRPLTSCYIEGTLKSFGANPGGCVSQAAGNAVGYAHGKAAVLPQQSEPCDLQEYSQ